MTLKVATIFGIFLILLTGYTSQVRAQSTTFDTSSPRKFDEFGAIGHCDMGARLDNFTIFLSHLPGATAYIVAYGPGGPGKDANQKQLVNLTEYLVNARGVNPDIIKTAYGGRNSELAQTRIQLWILPPNVAPPEPEKFESNIASFKGKLFEYDTYDDFGVWYESGETMGPGVGRLIQESVADVLQEQKNSVAYIVAYSGDDTLPGGWRRAADRELENLKELNIDPGRIRVIFGGQKKESKVQLWILPKDAPPPVVEAKNERTLKKVTVAGSLGADFLSYEKNEARSFKMMAEVLRTDKTLRAFIAVRLDAPAPPEGEVAKTETESEGVEDEDPDIEVRPTPDLTKLIEKWRTELITIHKIRSDRITVIFLPGTESNANSINVWFVPKGQPFPDPNIEEEEEEDPEPHQFE